MLLERSGLYQLLSPGRLHRWDDSWFTIREEDAHDWLAAAKEWRNKFAVPALVQKMWSELAASTVPFNSFPGSGRAVPSWVRAAVGLLITADEASAGIGYVRLDADPGSLSWIDLFDAKTESAWIKRNTDSPKSTEGHVLITTHRYTVGLMIAQDMVAVQPKARTPQVGASLRTMSQHLSLLPPPSRIGATWQRIASRGDDTKSDLNLLLIPFPYRIDKEWFSGVREGGPAGSWGWFDLAQSWLPADPAVFTEFVAALIERAEQEDADMKIDGIILPEYALTWAHHEHLVEYLANNHDEIEFVVSGSRTNCEKAEGNFALTSSINRSRTDGPIIQTNSRGKHHRWRLDKSQIEAYDLQEELDMELKSRWRSAGPIAQRPSCAAESCRAASGSHPRPSAALDPIWKARYPAAKVICPPGAKDAVEKAVNVDATTDVWDDPSVQLRTVPGIAGKEGALLVRREGGTTLVLNDLLANVHHPHGIGARIMARLLGFGVAKPQIPHVARWMFVKDKAALAMAFRNWADDSNLKRIVVSHGDVINANPRQVLREAANNLSP